MAESFRGWKRKVGVAVLTMACVMTSVWIRSMFIIDCWEYSSEQYTCHSWVSGRQQFHWRRFESLNPDILVGPYVGGWMTAPASRWIAFDNPNWDRFSDCAWRWGGAGFDVGEVRDVGINQRLYFWAVPYWSVVLPLTLISAWLLLSKQRQAWKPE